MRFRRDLWEELRLTAELALDARSTPAAARLVSDRARYVAHDGRDFIALNNALKGLTYAWQHAPDGAREYIEGAIKSTCAALDALPAHERITYFDALGLRKAAS